jgi:hypothetical protein
MKEDASNLIRWLFPALRVSIGCIVTMPETLW